ncbi:30S ribosomal protein S21, partial [Francisella tularensis subsp. holarctica]
RAVEKAGIKQELLDRHHYVKPTQNRNIAKTAAISKAKKEERRSYSY